MYPKKIGSFLARFIFAVVRYPARAEGKLDCEIAGKRHILRTLHIYTQTKVKHHPLFLSIYFFTSILLKQ
jgi:hypothetical protein